VPRIEKPTPDWTRLADPAKTSDKRQFRKQVIRQHVDNWRWRLRGLLDFVRPEKSKEKSKGTF
jgi:hypothetical protein